MTEHLIGRRLACTAAEAQRLLVEHCKQHNSQWASQGAYTQLSEAGEVIGLYQPLDEHLRHVAQGCADDLQSLQAETMGWALGWLHDLGKGSDAFQRRIQGAAQRTDHATAGAAVCRQLAVETGVEWYQLLAYVIAGHHSGLLDYLGDTSMEKRMLHRDLAADWQLYRQLQEKPALLAANAITLPIVREASQIGFRLMLLTRMLFSVLVDNDRFDAQCFGWPQLAQQRHCGSGLSELRLKLEAHLMQLQTEKQDTPMGAIRRQIVDACRHKAEGVQGFYSLCVPTGGGKTLSSMAFALRHGEKHHCARVIYALPFTAIIEQNAAVYRQIFGSEAVAECHCHVGLPEEGSDDGTLAQLFMENFDMPVVVTTNVNFFESLFTNRPSKVRKLHHYRNSVIILDEAQAIPISYIKPCMAALQELVDCYGCTVVFCTATQPDFVSNGMFWRPIELREIIDDVPQLFAQLKRVEGCYIGERSLAEMTEALCGERQALCIVNTKRHAAELFEALRGQEGLFHLSTNMYPEHRRRVIETIRQRLRENEPCLVVSTQLLEAGVDLDFPVVYRSAAGIDSLVQAAGRCNRERRQTSGQLRVFWPEKTYQGQGALQLTAELGRQIIEQYEDFLGTEAIAEYFRRLYQKIDHQTDAKDILNMDQLSVSRLHFDFARIGQSVKLIEDEGYGVVVPREAAAQQALAALAYAQHPGNLLRSLSGYTVSVRDGELRRLQENGLLREINGLLILERLESYDDDKGLFVLELQEADYFVD